MSDNTYVRMTHHERAQALVSEWMTRDMSMAERDDLLARIEAAFRAVAWQAQLDAIDNAPDPPKQRPRCGECGAHMYHSRLHGYVCMSNPRHEGIVR